MLSAAASATGAVPALQLSFDVLLAALRSAQLHLAVDLKAAEGRLLMMLKELSLLKVLAQICPNMCQPNPHVSAHACTYHALVRLCQS
jgi:hypothetical protein